MSQNRRGPHPRVTHSQVQETHINLKIYSQRLFTVTKLEGRGASPQGKDGPQGWPQPGEAQESEPEELRSCWREGCCRSL